MTLKARLKDLERRKIISRKPHPLIPFILAGIVLILYIYYTSLNKVISVILLILAIFAFVFAIIHYTITKMLE